jgi:hypothetical protein
MEVSFCNPTAHIFVLWVNFEIKSHNIFLGGPQVFLRDSSTLLTFPATADSGLKVLPVMLCASLILLQRFPVLVEAQQGIMEPFAAFDWIRDRRSAHD